MKGQCVGVDIFWRKAFCLRLSFWGTLGSFFQGLLSILPREPVAPNLEGKSEIYIVSELPGYVILMAEESSLRNTEVDVSVTVLSMSLVSFKSFLEKPLAAVFSQCPTLQGNSSASSCRNCCGFDCIRWAHLPSGTWSLDVSWGIWRAAQCSGLSHLKK